MTQKALTVANVGKKYHIGQQQTIDENFIDAAYRALQSPFRRALDIARGNKTGAAGLDQDFWALRDVSFEVTQGEVIGIIGKNGAGKSTLLKLLSRITDPTEGRIDIYGRVGSLLEVGTGFHPELTGRENVYMNGSILGMSKRDLDLKFDEIVEFAGVSQFIDTPFKHYSSGMGVRLAFSVAAHLEPEILIIDEVLAVGDVSFQQKSLGKMGEVASEGRTVLFVSHNIPVVRQLCKRGILLDHGRVVVDSDISTAVDTYVGSTQSVDGSISWENGIANEGVHEMAVQAVSIRNDTGEIASQIDYTKNYCVEVEYTITEDLPRLRVGIIISNHMKIDVLTTYDADVYHGQRPAGHYTSRCHLPGYLLAPGQYIISLNAGVINHKNLCHLDNLLSFTVIDTEKLDPHEKVQRSGLIRPRLEWELIR
ncbi:MAG: ABC transporter ATP-binding protein [Anaerolineae bacterium]